MKSFFENKIVKVILVLIKILLGIVIGIYLSFILLQRLSRNNSFFGYRVFTIATGSMTGVYNVDDVIAVKNCNDNILKVGDDIAYEGRENFFKGKVVIHRIVKIEKNRNGKIIFYTKGVNSNVIDPGIAEEQIIGKVLGIVPVITTISHIFKNQLEFFLIVFCPLVLVIVFEMLKTITDIKLNKHEIVDGATTEVADESEDEVKEEQKSWRNKIESLAILGWQNFIFLMMSIDIEKGNSSLNYEM